MRARFAFSLAAALPVAVGLCACASPEPDASTVAAADLAPPVTEVALTVAAAAEPAAPLERALAAIDVRSIRADVAFLADDALEGRGSPSPGLAIAARYFQSRLARLGFEPGTRAGWFHHYPLKSRRLESAGTSLAWTRAAEAPALVLAESFGVHPLDVRGGRWSGELVYGGDGRARELSAEQAAGKWVVYADQRYGRGRRLQRTAGELGALGVVLVGTTEREEPPFQAWLEQAERSRVSWPEADPDAERPCVWVSPAAAALPEGLEVGAPIAGELTLEIAGGGMVQMENVAGLWRGSGPKSNELVIVSAHYDHLGRDAEGTIHNGADDNASGSAALLALAEALAARGPLERSVLLLWVSAEELGLWGSRAWCASPDLPEGLVPFANVNLDMVGRNDPTYLEMTPSPEHEHSNALALAAIELASSEGFGAPTYVDRDFERSDQASFADGLGLPVVYLSAGEHPDYHEPGDDADKIDADKVARITRLVLRLLDQMQGAPLGS
jgi:hypothetical protein